MNRPMGTIGYILKGYPRISETFIAKEILQLESLGYKIRLFSLRKPRESFHHQFIDRIRAEIIYLPENITSRLGYCLCSAFRSFTAHPFPFIKSLALVIFNTLKTCNYYHAKRWLQACVICGRHVHGGQIVHYHSHFAHGPTTTAHYASMISRIPFSFSAHAKDIYTSRKNTLRKKIRSSRFAVSCTAYNVDYLRSLANTQDGTKIFLNYHGVDVKTFRFSPHLTKNGKDMYRILSVGRFVKKKGHDTLIDALHLLKQRGYRFQCHIIGGGELRYALKEQITNKDLLDHVFLMDAVQQNDLIQNYYSTADIFVLPCRICSDGDRDGLPNVLLESMALGIPCISTNVSAIPEVIINKYTGITVQPNNSEQLADAIAESIDNPELTRKYIHQARLLVERKHNTDNCIAELDQLLRNHIN